LSASAVRTITLGRAWAVQRAALGPLSPPVSPTSQPPALGECIGDGRIEGAAARGPFEFLVLALEIGVAVKIFEGERGGIE